VALTRNAWSNNGLYASSTVNRIAFFDTRPQHHGLSEALSAAFARVVSSGAFILGQEVSEFEHQCATLLGTNHAIGVSSGSDALFLALTALGIGPGDEVITTAFTFVATAEAVLRTGATPVFADIDPNHLGLCPESTRRMLSPKTRAVLYVHLYGNVGSIVEHAQICAENGLFLVEDACQAFGARLGKQYAGTWGQIGCFSFFPTKPLGGLGDGGLCVTHEPTLAENLRQLRAHGVAKNGESAVLSGNFRLDALQAALLCEKLPQVEAWRLVRSRIAETYTAALRTCVRIKAPSDVNVLTCPAWALYTVRVPAERQLLQHHLNEQGVDTRVYYPSVLANHRAFSQRCRCDTLTEALRASTEVLSIPSYFGLSSGQQQQVIDALMTWDRAR